MFFEAALMRWLSGGSHPTGLIFRLQGFDKGIFGGNFHTHNSLHLPPGVDVFCFSNGPDYARGFRTALTMAQQGRVIMLVDSTNLLNLRNLHDDTDGLWSFRIDEVEPAYHPDDVHVYLPAVDRPVIHTATGLVGTPPASTSTSTSGRRVAIVSYGNGVVTALQARRLFASQQPELGAALTVIDTPCLSQLPAALPRLLQDFDAVLFADVCKQGQHPLANFITQLQAQRALPAHWHCVAALPTYNPLGSTATFLSTADIIDGVKFVLTP
jgi:pyruvate/2-oxoglutarate/acetoin dehydrogenase E1 component